MIKQFFFFLLFAAIYQTSAAQTLPISISVPQVSPDGNQQFRVLNFDISDNGDAFSILYMQELNASVMTNKEFLDEGGDYVFEKPKKKDLIPNSNKIVLLVRQIISKNGESSTDKLWVLAERKMESADEYRLFFKKNFTHPIIRTDAPVTLTVHNLDNVEGLSKNEKEAVTIFVKRELFPDGSTYVNQGREKTAIESIVDLRDQIKSLKTSGLFTKGSLPKGESVLTKFSIIPKKDYVVTKQKGDNPILKFYLTADYSEYQLLDSLIIDGDVSMTTIHTVYDKAGNPVGVLNVFVVKSKDASGEKKSEILLVGVNDDDELGHWMFEAGKSGGSSVVPEVCYQDGKKIMVISSNIEKMFKPYYQVHALEMGKPAVTLYPETEDEQRSVKQKNTDMLQPNTGSYTSPGPLTEKYLPLMFISFDEVQYIITQQFARDRNKNIDENMGLMVYRLMAGKLTNAMSMPGYRSDVPIVNELLLDNKDSKYLMLGYPTKVQLKVDKEGAVVTPIESATNKLVPMINGNIIAENNAGLLLLSKTTMGTKYNFLWWPKG